MNIKLTIDRAANSAYIQMQESEIFTSKPIGEDIVLDLDEFGQVVGIEFLDLKAEIPFSYLIDKFHFRAELVDALRRVCPSISGFMSEFSTQATDNHDSRIDNSISA